MGLVDFMKGLFHRRAEISIHDLEYVMPRPVIERVARLVVKETAFENGFHNVDTPTAAVLEIYGFSPRVFVCISPRITLHREVGRETYRARPTERGLPDKYTIDLRRLRLRRADSDTPRVVRHLYWEVGGGGLDSGRPHRATVDINSGEVR